MSIVSYTAGGRRTTYSADLQLIALNLAELQIDFLTYEPISGPRFSVADLTGFPCQNEFTSMLNTRDDDLVDSRIHQYVAYSLH